MRLFNLLAVLAVPSLSIASGLRKDQYCLDAVYEAMDDLIFIGNTADEYWNATCQNPLKVTSMYASAKTYCTPQEIESGASLLAHYCMEYGFVELAPMSQFAENLTDESIKKMRVVNYEEIPETTNITEFIVLSPSYFSSSLRTVSTWEYEMWTHHTYGFAMYGFWGAILLIAILNNAYNSWWHSQASRSTLDIEGHHEPAISATDNIFTKANTWWKKTFIIPSVFGTRHRQLLYSFTVPTRMEAIIVFSYWALSLVLCAVNYRAFEGNIYWANISPQVWRYIADRAGIMTYANLPLIWMFSGRNNIFLWATGWDYATFNVFHRHIARVATIEAILHSVAYTVLYREEGYYTEELKEAWFYLGILATVSMSTLLLFSSVWIRMKFYEIFLLLHIILSVVVIVSLFYHTSIFDGEYNPYLWPLVAIWSFDRFLRLVRQAYCNLRIRFSKDIIETSTSVATYDQDANVIKITVTPASTLLKPGPGQFYYIYSPLTWKGWENHPFTLGSYGRPGQVKAQEPSLDVDKEMAIKEISVPESPSTSRSSWSESSGARPEEQQLVFWLRPFDGWTKGLRDTCLKNPNGCAKSRIMIEGPYGHAAHLHNYEHIVLIAGGTGISAVLPYIEEHIHRATAPRADESAPKASLRTREIDFIWTCKTPAFIHNICATELRPALARKDINSSFFSTSAVHTKSKSAETDVIEERSDAGAVEITVNQGRPDLTGTILQAARSNASGGSKAGYLAVLVCGPASMADEARNAVHLAMQEGCTKVEYIEETFGW